MNVIWNPSDTPQELHSILQTIAEEYPVESSPQNANVKFRFLPEAPDALKVSCRGKEWLIQYGRKTLAARGVAHVLAEQSCHEEAFFTTFGILLDCTRGNVVTVSRFKVWLRRLAMMGYNMAMIYVKDAYQLPGEPYFGYMRGAYSMEEIREIDAYAQKLGIEMIASIQALGHVEPVLRWNAYNHVKDTADVMLVDEPKTYELIEKMLQFWSDALSSRRIHLGMDETQTLGRGKFLDKNGYENPYFTYKRHLEKVCAICDKFHLKPTIWSDMYIHYAQKEMGYKDIRQPVPEEIRKETPANVQFSYWNYYKRDIDTYEVNLKRSGELNGTAPMMASGIWTWYRNWTDYEYSFNTVRPCVEGCRRSNTKELILTLWGDDGGYCEFNSALAGLAWAADLAYTNGEDEERTAQIFEAVCGTSYKRQLLCEKLTYTGFDEEGKVIDKVSSASMLWDDPIMGIVWNELPATRLKDPVENMLANYQSVRDNTAEYREDHAAGDLNYAWTLADLLCRKIELRKNLLKAYAEKNMKALDRIAEFEIPGVLEAIENFSDAFRTQWKRSFKPYGLELMQIRLGGLNERYYELSRLIGEFRNGEIDAIPELEVKHTPSGPVPHQYFRCVTGCFFV